MTPFILANNILIYNKEQTYNCILYKHFLNQNVYIEFVNGRLNPMYVKKGYTRTEFNQSRIIL